MYVKLLACAKGTIHGSDYFYYCCYYYNSSGHFSLFGRKVSVQQEKALRPGLSQSELNALLLALPHLPVLTSSSPGLTFRERDEGQGGGQRAGLEGSLRRPPERPSCWSRASLCSSEAVGLQILPLTLRAPSREEFA